MCLAALKNMERARSFFYLATLILTVFVTLSEPAFAKGGQDLTLVAKIAGQRQIAISPLNYPAEILAEYLALDAERQAQFLALRQDKLSKVLQSLKGQLLDEPDPELSDGGWFSSQATKLMKTIDMLLFQNCKLLTSPAREVGTLYTAQMVFYWGIGKRVKGLGLELSFLHHRDAQGQTQTTLSLDRIQVLRAYVPIPMASASFRVIRFNSLRGEDDQMENVTVDHLPLGPVTSKGNNHLGLGFGAGLAFPPFPFSTFTGFTAKRMKQKVLWTCANLLKGA